MIQILHFPQRTTLENFFEKIFPKLHEIQNLVVCIFEGLLKYFANLFGYKYVAVEAKYGIQKAAQLLLPSLEKAFSELKWVEPNHVREVL